MPIRSAEQYIESLRNRNLNVYLFGERVEEPVDHPVVRPSINAVAETYRLAEEEPELGAADSTLVDGKVNRFLHVAGSAQDVVTQNRMQRRLGQRTGTCFQRCVGMDAINALYSITFELDEKHGTDHHARFLAFVKEMQAENFVIGGAMTDPKGDRSKAPSQQEDPDLFVRVVERRDDGVVIRGAKMHQTGCINSHWLLVMPTMRLSEADRDYAISCAVPVDHPGISYIYGRQSCDSRALEGGEIDQGNARFGGQEAAIIFDNVFVPNERIFIDGQYEYAAPLVERFTSFHRRSYVCKTGLGDVIIGAAATIADYNGVPKASHVRDKLVEMAHLNETIYGAGIAASHESKPTAAGNYQCDDMLANVCKHNVTRFPYELSRLAQDLAGGLMVTLPSDKEFDSEVTGPVLRKYLKAAPGVSVDNRRRVLRLIENMTLGRNAVGYLTESMHGAGSPQAQRVQIARMMNLEEKKKLAKHLAGVEDESEDEDAL
ncbi:MAG: 4-hydroxybutyryl-CoA dehydratase [Myxococcales bacterium]|nr:4-hydroxybutyryl-CoA dehydratase [Myxococcales bacterium]